MSGLSYQHGNDLGPPVPPEGTFGLLIVFAAVSGFCAVEIDDLGDIRTFDEI